MGKSLIIQGADFSVNGIIDPYQIYPKGVTSSVQNQKIILSFLNNVSLHMANVRYIVEGVILDDSVTSVTCGQIFWHDSLNTNRMGLTNLNKTREILCVNINFTEYTDRISIWSTNDKFKFDFSTSVATVYKNDVSIEEKAFQNDYSDIASAIATGCVLRPWGVLDSAWVAFTHIQAIKRDTNTLILDAYSAKDLNNKACFVDLLTDSLYYANDGNDLALVP